MLEDAVSHKFLVPTKSHKITQNHIYELDLIITKA